MIDDKIAIRKDDILKQMAINIFGDIIEEAYITCFPYVNKQDIDNTLKLNTFKHIEEGIDIGAQNIILKFTTGKSVCFTNSEWGTIESINMEIQTKEM